MEKIKKRKPLIALLLSIFNPFLGQLYNGQHTKAIVFFILWMLLSIPFLFFDLLLSFEGFIITIILVTIAFCIYVVICIDAFRSARKLGRIELKPYNKWYIYVAIILINFIVSQDLPDFTAKTKAYKIPSIAMSPTLKVGDRIVVDLGCCDVSIPEHGDIIVFRFSKNPKREFIKRVIGIAGDTIEIRNKTLYVNNEFFKEPYVIYSKEIDEVKKANVMVNFGPIAVSEGKIFVLGDNRGKSYDSRFWGFVKTKDVIGKALYIYWAKDKTRIGMTLSSKS